MLPAFTPGIGALLAACRVFLDECKCPLCDKPWRKASTFPCGHTFCYDCAMATLEGPGISQSECPYCKEKFWKKELRSNPQMIAVVEHTQRLISEAASAFAIPAGGRPGAVENFPKDNMLLGQTAVGNPAARVRSPRQGPMAWPTVQGSMPEAVQSPAIMPADGMARLETSHTQLLAQPCSQPAFSWPSLSQGRHLGGTGWGLQPFGSLARLRRETQNVNKGYLEFHTLLEQAVTQMATDPGWQEPPACVAAAASHGAGDHGQHGLGDFDELAWLRSVSELPAPTDQEREALELEHNIVAMFLEELDQQIEEERNRNHVHGAAVALVAEENRVQPTIGNVPQPLAEEVVAGATSEAAHHDIGNVQKPGRLSPVPQGPGEVVALPSLNAHRQVAAASEQPLPMGDAAGSAKPSVEAFLDHARPVAFPQSSHEFGAAGCPGLKILDGGEGLAPVGRTCDVVRTGAVTATHPRARVSDDGTVGDILAGPLLETHQDEAEPASMEDCAGQDAMQMQREALFPARLSTTSSQRGDDPDTRHRNKRTRAEAGGSSFGLQRATPLRSPFLRTGGDMSGLPHVNVASPGHPGLLPFWGLRSPESRGMARDLHATAVAPAVGANSCNEAKALGEVVQEPDDDRLGSTLHAAPNALVVAAGTLRPSAAGEVKHATAALRPPPSPGPRVQEKPAGACGAAATAACKPPEVAPTAATAPGRRKTVQRKRQRSEPPLAARPADNVPAEPNQQQQPRRAAQAQAQPAPAPAQRTARRGRERSSAAVDTAAPSTAVETAGGPRRVKPVYVCTTAVAPSDRGKPRELARRIRGVELLDDVTPSMTHMVVSLTDKGFAGARTVKYLRAVMQGCWVVGVEWVEACLATGQLVSEAPYEARGDTTHEGAPAKGRLRLARGEPALFRGVKFCVTYLKPAPEGGYTRPDLEALLQAAGGSLVRRPPQRAAPATTTAAAALFGTFALADPYDGAADSGSPSPQTLSEADTSDTPVPFGVPPVAVLLAPRDYGEAARVVREWGCAPIEATWVFDSISYYRIMPVEPYTLAIASS